MQAPKTQVELLRAVREVVGPDAHVCITSELDSYGTGELRTGWKIYVGKSNSQVYSTGTCSSHRSIASAWQAFKDKFLPEEIAPEQFDAHTLEVANAE